jgi:hypothetical protein
VSRSTDYRPQRRTEEYRLADRERARLRYRRLNGKPLDAPVRETGAGRWKDPPHECLRCSEPHAPGSELCWDHQRIMAELAKEEGEG